MRICQSWERAMAKKGIFILFIVGIFFNCCLNIVVASNLDKNTGTAPLITLPDIKVIKGVVKKKETASSLLNKYLPLKTIYEICRQSKNIFSLAYIKAGRPYKIILQENCLIGFEYEINKKDRLVVQKEKNNFSVKRLPIQYDVNIQVVTSTIESTLFEAVKKAGERNELAQKLSDIFAWDIDFLRHIQPGDQFRVLVEKKYRDGKLSGYGKIQAAFFNNKGTLFKAFLYKNANGVPRYYNENGKPLQKAFLKAPLAFTRISSKFTLKRFHPIFKEYRPHPGVDYSAPKGTPIRTVGDGVITQIGFNTGGMGNCIKIQHYNGYTTSYNHMSKFAHGMAKNKKVLQGDVIGYVGMTGRATGPHLDFRMTKNGKLVDPLKNRPPSTTPIKPDEMEAFIARTIELSERIMTAQNLDSHEKKTS